MARRNDNVRVLPINHLNENGELNDEGKRELKEYIQSLVEGDGELEMSYLGEHVGWDFNVSMDGLPFMKAVSCLPVEIMELIRRTTDDKTFPKVAQNMLVNIILNCTTAINELKREECIGEEDFAKELFDSVSESTERFLTENRSKFKKVVINREVGA